MASTDSVNSDEIFVVLERIYLRLGLAEDSDQLSLFCTKYLPELLERLESSVKQQDSASRDKILDILTQLKRRLRANQETQLPVDLLLNEYKKDSSPLLKIGFMRLPVSSQVNCMPKLLEALLNKSGDQQLGLWFQFLPVIRIYYNTAVKDRPVEAEKRSTLLDLTQAELPTDFVTKFLTFCAEFLLLTEGTFPSRSSDVRFPSSRPASFVPPGFDDLDGEPAPAPTTPSGISSAFYMMWLEEMKTQPFEYFSSSGTRSGSSGLTETKVGIIRMLGKCLLPSQEIAWLWALASADSHHSVAHEAEMQLKQAPGAGLNDVRAMRKLYEFYLGYQKNQTMPEGERRAPVELRVKLKLMTYFLRYADTAASVIPQSVQMLFENWFGRETNERLKLLGIEFASYVVSKLKDKTAALFAPIIFANVKKVQSETSDPKLGSACYTVLGKVGLLHPNYVFVGNKRVEMIQDLFDDLSQIDNEDVCVSVQSCLFDWLEGFIMNAKRSCTGDNSLLEAVVTAYAEHKSPKCRLVALRFLAKLFPVDHAPSRFALFLARDDPDEKVRKEAAGIIRSTESDIDDLRSQSGSFEQTSKFFYEKVIKLFEKQSDASEGGKRITNGTLKQMITYLRQQRSKQLSDKSMSSKMDDGSEDLDEFEQDDVDMFRQFLSIAEHGKEWFPYYQLITIYLNEFGANDNEIMDYIAEIVFVSPESIVQDLLPSLLPIVPKIHDSLQTSTNERLITKIIDVLAFAYSKTKNRMELEQELQYSIQHMKADQVLSAAKVLLSAQLCADMYTSTDSSNVAILLEYSRSLVLRFCRAVDNWELTNLDVSATGLASLVLKLCLSKALDNEMVRRVYLAALEVIKSRKEAVTTRYKERCVDLLGCWITNEPGLAHWTDVVQEIINVAEGPPNIGFQATVGKLLVSYCLAPIGCSLYGDARVQYTRSDGYMKRRLSECSINGNEQTETGRRVDWLLDHLLVGENAEHRMKNKNYKQACCMWMEIFLRTCGRRNFIQQHLERLQTFVLDCLAEENTFTQDIASRSLSILFRCCRSPEKRSSLAKLLREQLIATTAKATLLPYQELCCLCTVNCQQPQLIYDLMLLGLNQRPTTKLTVKTDRLPIIVVRSIEMMKQFERILVPAFFRFTYDPNPSVKRVFQNIWACINGYYRENATSDSMTKVSNTESLTEKYSSEIFDHLLVNLESNQWRYREASCVSLSDLLNGSRITQRALDRLGDLWQCALRLLDDMKESVVLAAAKLIHALTKFTVRMCSSDGCPSITLPIVIPRLVEFGLQSNAGMVKLASLSTLMALIKESPPAILRPHLAILLSSLLDALSWTESDKVSSVAMRADAEIREQIDQARVAASKSSPIMDSLEICCRHVDVDVLRLFVPKLIQTLQSNVGLSTKSGACRLAIILRLQASSALSPFADSLMKCFIRCMTDRNTTLRKQVASAIGHVAPLCLEPALNELFTTVQRWYLDIENPSLELSSCHTLRALALYSPDILKAYGSQAAPIVFLALHNDINTADQSGEQLADAERIKAMWEETSTELTLSTHIVDIYEFCAQLLTENPSWRLKTLSAKAIGALVLQMDSNLAHDKICGIILLLTKSLEGRTWDGKEQVLISLGMVAQKYGTVLARDMPLNDKQMIIDILMRECQKTNKPKYRVHAISQTALIAEVISLALWKRLYDIVAPDIFMEIHHEQEDDTKHDEARYVSYIALARSLTEEQAQEYASDVRKYGSLLLERLPTVVWREQVPILDAVVKIFDKTISHLIFDGARVLDTMITTIGRSRQSAVKQRCVTILRSVCDNLLNNGVFKDIFMRSPEAQDIMKRILEDENLKTLAPDVIHRMSEFWKP